MASQQNQNNEGNKIVTIGGAAGMWGDSMTSTAQLLGTDKLQYLIYECLAEITMAIMTKAKLKSENLGYAVDIIDPTLAMNLQQIKNQGIRVVTNAGGVNPHAAANALRTIAQKQQLSLKIAVVEGDDLMPHLQTLNDLNLKEMEHGTPVPQKLVSMNAYFGALPIAKALDAGADVVITGRVVDSALVLGPLIHEFNWQANEFDKLAQGSLAGHLLECGPQSTGGLITDWETVASWVNMGFPIAECNADGSFIICKPEGSDGVVNRASITEQILYEIGDPSAYVLPDVVCDFTQVKLEEQSDNRVRVSGAKGRAPTPYYKACAQEMDGYRLQFIALVGGRDAAAKALRVGESIITRGRHLLDLMNFGDFRDVCIETLGAEHTYGPHSRAQNTREVVLRIAVHHNDKKALMLFAREIPSVGLAMAQGLSGGGAGRAMPTPFFQLHSFLIPRDILTPKLSMDNEELDLGDMTVGYQELPDSKPDNSSINATIFVNSVEVPLLSLAFGRSGDKGNYCNIGICARHQDFLPIIEQQVTAVKVREYLAHLVKGNVDRFALPSLLAFNFLMSDALGGGGTASLRFDAQGKATAQMLLDMPLQIPNEILKHPAFKTVAF